MVIREAVESDLPAFAVIFREVVDAGETYAYPDDLTDAQIHDLWFESPSGRTVVAVEQDGSLLGSAKMGPNRPGRGSHVGTASFMVASAARGKGVGRTLAEDVVAWHRDQGYAAIQFNAVVAVRLWQDLGFRILTTVPGAFESRTHGRVGLHVMLLEL